MRSDSDAVIDVFFSYSQVDEALRDKLETHLALLKRQSVRTWHDRRIDAGQVSEEEIDRHLEAADLILLLISPSFLASDYCFKREMKRALERHAAGEARVVPVILRPTDWQSADFAQLQALPKDSKPITTWRNRDQGFVDVVRGLRRVIAELQQDREKAQVPPQPVYADEATRELSEALEQARERKSRLEDQGVDVTDVIEEILDLRRRLRQGAKLKAGDSLLEDRFRLLEEIGQGGFAQVWKAFDRHQKCEVALKVLHGQHTSDQSRRERFFRGARQMARLQHPHVVPVFEEQCEDGEYPFFVMEYLSGGDFRHAVLAGRLTLHERLQIVLEVGEALGLAHSRGVIHRDVKPHNVLLTMDGSPKLTDFDLVRAADTTGGTRTAMLGTFLYASPEAMVDARQASEAADVYGLGMTAIFALHGADLPSDVLWELPGFVAQLEVGEACRQALLRSVARKIEDRWSSVEEFGDALRAAMLEDASEGVRKESPAIVVPSTPVAEFSSREQIHEADGSVLVYVPEGEFILGTDEDLPGIDADYQHWWKPAHRAHLSDFWIGKLPVTNEQYARFLETNPDHEKPEYWQDEDFNASKQPVVGVSWLDAVAYCAWVGLELPSEAQWEAAARGHAGRPYPWGKAAPSSEFANYGRNQGCTTAVGSYPPGVGPFGTLDQAGNVLEWCVDDFDPKAYRDRDGQKDPVIKPRDLSGQNVDRVLRGGSWASPSLSLLAAIRHWSRAGSRSPGFGFRVCRSGSEP